MAFEALDQQFPYLLRILPLTGNARDHNDFDTNTVNHLECTLHIYGTMKRQDIHKPHEETSKGLSNIVMIKNY